MQWPAQLDLALDIDDLAATETDPGGDAARIAEGESAEADDREPVDLADLLAFGLDADRPAADLLLQAPVDAIAAADLRIDRRLYLRFADDVPAGVGGELVGFLQQIDKAAHAGRQFVGVARKPGSPLDYPRHRLAIERPEPLAPADGADQPRVEQRHFGRAVDAVVGVGGNLEQLGKLLVISAEHVIERWRPHQNDFDVERDRLRRERDRARQAQQLFQRLDPDFAGIERALQRGPAVIPGQQLGRVENQVAAIRPMQGTGCQEVEIGDQ